MSERSARRVEGEREPLRTPDAPARSGAVSAREAAAILAVHERTVRRAISRGELAADKQGRSFRISLAALDDYRARLEQPGQATARLRLVEPDEPEAAAPPAVVPLLGRGRGWRGGLPAPLSRFVGRAEAVAALAALLRRDDVRLLTVTGPGGVGKTRLALRAAEEVAPEFADGAAFVALAPLRDPGLVPFAIAQALGVREGEGGSPLARLKATLRDAQALLVLDNFERVVDAGPAVVDVLMACPGITALVTSRVLLNVSGEHAFAAAPLALPRSFGRPADPAPLPPPDELGQVESIQLFVDRARAARSDFALTAENAAAVAAVCARVDGLPLAIELAAARAAVLTPASLLARMERRLPLLTGGPHDQPGRLRAMRDAIAWSDDLLDPTARAHFRRLAVFRGGFGADAAERVAALATSGEGDAPPEGCPAVVDSLASLLAGSLLQRSERPDGESRFAMLETVREFALEQLIAAGEEQTARAAHAACFRDFVEQAQAELWAAASEQLLDRIEIEHDNLRGALEWAVAHEPETALRLAAGLAMFWSKRAYWSEGRAWLERALAAGAGGDSLPRAAALGRLGAIVGDQGEFDAARGLLSESLAMAERLGAADVAARALRGLGILASNQSDFPEAEALFGQALERFRALDDRPGVARCLNDLGLVADRRGDHDAAIAYQEEALPIARALGDDWQVCIILGNLGGAYAERGERVRGAALTEEALELARRLGDAFGVAVNLHNLANLMVEMGDARAAVPSYREALALSQELGEQHLASRTLDRLAVALHCCGAARPAARLLGAAEAAREAAGDALFAEEAAIMAPKLQALRDDLGEAAFAAAWGNGRSLPFDRAVAEAVALADALPPPAPAAPARAGAGLTAREIEVLRLLAEGKADREIAEALFVARTTASKHVAAIIAKLGVDSRTAAVVLALRRGLV